MKINLTFYFLLLIFASCDSQSEQHIKSDILQPEIVAVINHDIWMKSWNPVRTLDKSGFEINFYNGNVSEEGMRIDGRMNGIWINYYPDGTVKSQIGYWDDMLDGVYRTYYSNGQLKKVGYHFLQKRPVFETEGMIEPETNDSVWVESILNNQLLKHGFWNQYDSLGNLTESIEYDKGEKKK